MLLPTTVAIVGAVGKSELDILADVVKKWLAARPGEREVEILRPDGQVVRIVKIGKQIVFPNIPITLKPPFRLLPLYFAQITTARPAESHRV